MIDPRQANQIANRYRGEVPVRVFDLVRELRLGPVFDNTLPEDVSGLIRKRSDGEWEIVINAKHSEVRQKFTAAHEIGHFIHHRNRLEIAGGTSDTLAYRSDEKLTPHSAIGWLQEYQANQFASSLLVPQRALQDAVERGMNENELAKHFGVSLAAIRIKRGPAPGRTPGR